MNEDELTMLKEHLADSNYELVPLPQRREGTAFRIRSRAEGRLIQGLIAFRDQEGSRISTGGRGRGYIYPMRDWRQLADALIALARAHDDYTLLREPMDQVIGVASFTWIQWDDAKYQKKLAYLRTLGWEVMPVGENDRLLLEFKSAFQFRPSVDPAAFPGIREPQWSTTVDLRAVFEATGDMMSPPLPCEVEARRALVEALRTCVTENERVYALNWNHDGFSIDPRDRRLIDHAEAWPWHLLPRGDYYVVITADYRLGTFGHPREQSLCVFGHPFRDVFMKTAPKEFRVVLRGHEHN